MNRRDLPPGQRLMRLRRDERGSVVEPGDVLCERGPRIGERWWQVVDVEQCSKYDHAACRSLLFDEMIEIRRADPDGNYWHLTKG